MSVAIHPSRYHVLQSEFEQPYFSQIKDFLLSEKQAGITIYPPNQQIFKAFDLTPFERVQVVILGQDPYHGVGQAMGLSFSVPDGISLPPSLRNIYKELHDEGFANYQAASPLISDGKISGNLTRRAEQGVLLLNAILTVRANQAASHSQIGRQHFTDAVIRQIASKQSGIVFLLRGSYAQSKKSIIQQARTANGTNGLILEAVHPSPLSAHRGWFGCNHFRQTNAYLISQGKSEIVW